MVLTPQVGTVGRGAVIAAAAMVTRPVPAYAIVASNPARLLRIRFDPATVAGIETTGWWELDSAGLRALIADEPELVFSPAEHFAGKWRGQTMP